MREESGAVSTHPEPVLPDYGGRCLTNVVPALLGSLSSVDRPGDRPRWDPPAWLNEAGLGEARRIVLLVLDGLGSEQLSSRRSCAPTMAAAVGTTITTVAPSTTAAALTSLATGLVPAIHGVAGYRIALDGGILNVLRWQVDGTDVRRRMPPCFIQPFAAFPGRSGVPVVSRADYATTGFTAAHLGGSRLRGWEVPSSIAVEIRDLLGAGERFVYAYYDGIDRIAHTRGLGAHYEAELRAADRIVGDVLEILPSDVAFVVTADHGQVEVGRRVEVVAGELMSGVELLSGEGRYRWLHTKKGATHDVVSAALELYGHVSWVRTREQVIDEGWMGGVPDPAIARRLGDVVLAPFAATAFLDPSDCGEQRLVGRHGSLTRDEMLVPLLCWRPRG